MSQPVPPQSEKPPPDEAIPLARLAMWAVLAAVLAFGVYLYFRYEAEMIPLHG